MMRPKTDFYVEKKITVLRNLKLLIKIKFRIENEDRRCSPQRCKIILKNSIFKKKSFKFYFMSSIFIFSRRKKFGFREILSYI